MLRVKHRVGGRGRKTHRRDDCGGPVPDVIVGIGVIHEQLHYSVPRLEHEDEDRALERERWGRFRGHGVLEHDPAVPQGALGLQLGDTGEVRSGLG